MTSIEKLKYKRKTALIVIYTLGLVGVSQFGSAGGIVIRQMQFANTGLNFKT